MPEMDGLEATRWIRQKEGEGGNSEPIAVVALTAHASRAQHDQCIAPAMDGVVTKPVNVPALLSCIGTVLAARRVSATTPFST